MKPKLGSGQRFSQLKSKLSKQPGVSDPGALAASIGRKKYGKSKFQGLAKAGKTSMRHPKGTKKTFSQGYSY